MKNRKDKTNILLSWIFGKFILRMIVITLLIHAVFIMVYIIADVLVVKTDFQWLHDIEPDLYYNFREMFYSGPYNAVALLIEFVIIITVIVILLYFTLKKVISYITALSEASNQLLDKDVEMIYLPEELSDIQSKMNLLKMTSEKNERLAAENEKRKNDLIVYLAHDIKTPLTSMIGYLSLIDEIKDMPREQREKYVNIALEKSYKLEDLINELFDITRFNAETIVLEKEEINLNMMLEQIIEDFYPLLKEIDKEIQYYANESIVVEGDSDKLYRVFNNLIKNAIHYSTDKVIKIKAEAFGDKVRIIVSNKGKRIPKEKLERLFEKFYRADSSRTSKTGGSGLGLAIAKEIVELHGGNIKAASEDGDIKFYVELPVK